MRCLLIQALDRAKDIYQRIHKRMQKSGAEEKSPAKLWEIRFRVLKTWFYQRDFSGVAKAVRLWLLFSRPGADIDNPGEEDWKAALLAFVQERGWSPSLLESMLASSRGPNP